MTPSHRLALDHDGVVTPGRPVALPSRPPREHVDLPGRRDAAPFVDGDPLARLVRGVLDGLGEDSRREGLLGTPDRVARSLRFLTSGYTQDVDELVNGAVFEEPYSEIVLVKDIEVFSLCEHHLLPFIGKAHVAYVPDGRVIGLSKLPRIVDMFARRLQVQERLTTEVAEAVDAALRPLGVAVVVEAAHLCMMMRGVQKQNSLTTTSSMRGVFLDDPGTRSELLELLYRGRSA